MKRELSTPILLGTFLEMTTFLRVTISKTALISNKGPAIESTCVRGIFIEGACANNPCAGGASAIEHSKTDLQSFHISEVKLLGT